MAKPKPGLGKGYKGEAFEAVYKTNAKTNVIQESQKQTKQSKTHEVIDVEISKIVMNPLQPRKEFDQEKLTELKDTILKHGLMQPITVKELVDGNYELIAGERRYRAFQLAGYDIIPAIVTSISSEGEQLEKALIENIQREDLNSIEIAVSYQQLNEKCNYTQEQLAEKVGKDRSTVTNFIRLLKLPSYVQDLLISKKISVGHARVLLSLENNSDMVTVADDIVSKGLSVRTTESLVKDIITGKNSLKKEKNKPEIDKQTTEEQIIIEELQNKLQDIYGTKVRIISKNNNNGTIEIEFYSTDDLERIVELLESNIL
jgi:ParB family chromosome partitioning protein